jgi:hypothetical protein
MHIQGMDMVRHVQLSTNCNFEIKQNIFLRASRQFFSRLTTAQVVDPLPCIEISLVEGRPEEFFQGSTVGKIEYICQTVK